MQKYNYFKYALHAYYIVRSTRKIALSTLFSALLVLISNLYLSDLILS